MHSYPSLIAAAAIAALSGCSPVESLPPFKSPINWTPEGYGCLFVAPPDPIVVERPRNPADCLAIPGAPKRLHMLVRVRGAGGAVERVAGNCSPEPYAIDAEVLKCIQTAVDTWSYLPFSSCDPMWGSPESLLLAAPKRAGEHGTAAHLSGLPECHEAGV